LRSNEEGRAEEAEFLKHPSSAGSVLDNDTVIWSSQILVYLAHRMEMKIGCQTTESMGKIMQWLWFG